MTRFLADIRSFTSVHDDRRIVRQHVRQPMQPGHKTMRQPLTNPAGHAYMAAYDVFIVHTNATDEFCWVSATHSPPNPSILVAMVLPYGMYERQYHTIAQNWHTTHSTISKPCSKPT
mmetsp:Transcript_38992/g.97578  ORF Transcript_38992/g.97578 Transcript_38992/m.97578 type:complete len:117 (+) Transcript_38992:38-388(+)